jgi:hypothetical protein
MLQEAIQSQNNIGWGYIWYGMVSLKWKAIQQSYLLRTHSKLSPRRWVTSLIKKLWDIAWDFWEHRNGIIHSKETGLLIITLNAEIQEQFQIGIAGIMRSTRPLFGAGEASILQFSIEAKQLWLNRIKQS